MPKTKLIRWFGVVTGVLLLLLAAALIAVQAPSVQTRIGKKAIGILNDKIDGEIHLSRISVEPFSGITLENVVVLDAHPWESEFLPRKDTLAKIGFASVKFSPKSLIRNGGIYISSALVRDGELNLVISPDSLNSGRSNNNIQTVFRLKSGNNPPEDKGDLFEIGLAKVENFHFTMLNHGLKEKNIGNGSLFPEYAMDWADLDATAHSILARNVKMSNNVMSGTLLSSRMSEKCGAVYDNISGYARVGKKRTVIRNLNIKDQFSDIHADIVMSYNGNESWSNFIEEVKLDGSIKKPTALDMRSIVPFAPELHGMEFTADVDGDVSGYVNDLSAKNISFSEKRSGVSGNTSVTITGLPESLFLDGRIQNMNFTAAGLSKALGGFARTSDIGIGSLAKGEHFALSGNFRGPLNRLLVDATLSNREGRLKVGADIRNLVDKNRPLTIGGTMDAVQLDLGALSGIGALGPVSMKTALSGVIDGKEGLSVELDSLSIGSLSALGYTYTDILASGRYENDAFDGRVVCNDPNLNFLFQGLFSFSSRTKNSAYRFFAELGYADLQALNIDKRGTSKVSLTASADMVRTGGGEYVGHVRLNDIELENAAGVHRIGDITLGGNSGTDEQRIKLSSSFANGTFVGSRPVIDMVKDLRHLAVLEPLPALAKTEIQPWEGASYDVSLSLGDTRELLAFIAPGVYVADSTALRLSVRGNGLLDASLRSQRIALRDKYLKDLKVSIDNENGNLAGRITTSSLKAGGIEFLNAAATLFAGDNHIGLGLDYDNETDEDNRGEFYLGGDFLRKDDGQLRITAQVLPSNIYYNDNAWSMHSGDIVIEGKDISVDNLAVDSEEESILVSGGFSPDRSDTLTVRLNNFDLSVANYALGTDYGISGIATGNALIISPSEKMPGILAGITCENASFGSRPLGTLNLASVWNRDSEAFDLFVRSEKDGFRNIDIGGYIKPSTKSIHALANLSGVDLGHATPFLNTVFSELEGSVNGLIRVDGNLDKIHISSEGLHLSDGLMKLDFTKVPYHVNGNLSLTEEALSFDDVRLDDGNGGSGSVNGSVLWNRFIDIGLDTHMDFNNMKVLAISPEEKDILYGNANASGHVDISGTLSKLELKVDAATRGNGDVHIPLSSYDSARNSGLLSFKEPKVEKKVDVYDLMMGTSGKKKSSSSSLGINLKLQVSPSINAFIELSGSTASAITGNGSGNIDIDFRNSKLLLGGDYTLTSGGFNFSAMNLVARKFTLREGSSVRFAGEVMDTELNIDGIYTTKASLSTLLADTTATSRRTVNCGIKITDKMRNPSIGLSIEVPDLDPATQSMVESALNTEDKMQKQFLSILVANSFLPSEESGIVSANSNLLMSNFSAIMSGQLSNIFQKLNIPLDLGFNYEPTDHGNDLFDVAISTQLFNNRVVVNGSIGSKKYGTNGDVAGDLDIGIKLNRQGSLRLNLFSHSADQYTSYLDNSQRNGIGIAWQREFNNFGEFFTTLFMSRAKRLEYFSSKLEESRRTVQIDSTGKAIVNEK